MKLVIIESPYAGACRSHETRNIEYAKQCIKDSLLRDESPIASHLLYTQPGILDDNIQAERQLGISAGVAWYRVAELCAVYTDLDISEGMKQGIQVARNNGVKVEFRTIYKGIENV